MAQKPITIENFEKLKQVLNIINFAYVDTVDQDKLMEEAIINLLEQLDPHSIYISKEELKELNEPLEGNFEGIGIQFNIVRDTIVVAATVAGGPAEKSGVQAGDKIVKIEGQDVAGVSIKNPDVSKKLRGGKGTRVTVSVYRKGIKKLLDFTITRDKVPIYSLEASYLIPPSTGYVKINRFAQTTVEEFKIALQKLKEQGAKDLILDLEDNGGGYLNTAIDLADEFLSDKKLIVYTEGAFSPKILSFATAQGQFEKGKLVIMINEGSASASEIVAGSVQDWDRGLIVGRRSFGKGLVQKPFPLPDGSMIRLTTARYFTPVGRSIQKPYDKGIDEYFNDLTNRYQHGEFTNKDSTSLPDSLKFYTPNKRMVYGGGGIMPDVFVPIDTSEITEFHGELIRLGVLSNYSFDYVDKNRQKLIAAYPDFNLFNKNFKVDKTMLDELVIYAEKEGIKKDEKKLLSSKDIIVTQLKGLIARDLWNNDAFYQIINTLNPSYNKSIELINKQNFKRLKINVN